MALGRWARRIAAVALPLVTVIAVGFLAVQIEGESRGRWIGFNGLPMGAGGSPRFAWELEVGLLVTGVVAVFVYRRLIDSLGARLMVLAVLLVTAAVSVVAFERLEWGVWSLPAVVLVYGGTSPFIMAFASGVAVDSGMKWRDMRKSRAPERVL